MANEGLKEKRPEYEPAVAKLSELTFGIIKHRLGGDCDDHGEFCMETMESAIAEIDDVDLLRRMVTAAASSIANNYISEKMSSMAAVRAVVAGLFGIDVHPHGGKECRETDSQKAQGGDDNAAETVST